jgi:hypothetical protein
MRLGAAVATGVRREGTQDFREKSKVHFSTITNKHNMSHLPTLPNHAHTVIGWLDEQGMSSARDWTDIRPCYLRRARDGGSGGLSEGRSSTPVALNLSP